MKKRSFFERLSASSPHDDFDAFDDDFPIQHPGMPAQQAPQRSVPVSGMTMPTQVAPTLAPAPVEEEVAEGQLPVDVYQTANDIIIRTFIAAVRPDEMNVSISRDMVVIEGSREERDSIVDGDYFARELFWGRFAKTILLPQEVDVDASTATAKDGLLTITLPKLDKARQTKLRVKAG
ncbi:MAG: Hsp20/alpha crystallin family protein [Candidatus Pacebacteria bacterium]|nr:Hsp20/alpha crystallin family protein [Candidatus Paceibacterota bacterium]